jgi:hypothetical protein
VDSPAADSLAQLSDLPELSESLVVASQPYVGRWNRLVSTTNWEKGRIIVQWREALISQGLPVAEYSDQAWCRLVGGVTGQHVGRLRRVFQRFGQTQDQFKGLYWSHFQAALDWDDAEMWLEGAKTSGWSVNEMRTTRWETLGKLEADRPRPQDAVASETDEDFEPATRERAAPGAITGEYDEVVGPRHDGPDFGDEPAAHSGADFPSGSASATEPVELIRPFENLPELPDDLAEAFDTMKLAILRHKTAEWREISAGDVLRTLDALKALVVAPSADAPF